MGKSFCAAYLTLFLCFFCFSFSVVNAQTLKGRIVDEQGNGIPYAGLYIYEISQGVSTTEEGDFELKLEPGEYHCVFQHISYEPENVTITIPLKESLLVTLKNKVYDLTVVDISDKHEDPAYRIMRKAIAMAPYYRNQIGEYKAEVYLKGTGKIDKIGGLVKAMAKKEIAEAGVKEGDKYVLESVNEIYYKSPNTYEEKIISKRGSFPAGIDVKLGTLLYNVYQTDSDVVLSPLSPQAFSHYNFKYMGFSTQNGRDVNEIKVIPKRKSKMLLSGTLYIIEDLWNVYQLDLTAQNLGIGGSARYKQTYAEIEEGLYMPVIFNFSIDVSIAGNKASGTYTSSVKYSNFKKNSKLAHMNGNVLNNVPTPSVPQPAPKPKTAKAKKIEEQIEKIAEKEKLSNRDALKLSKLMRESADEAAKADTLTAEQKKSLEIVTSHKFTEDSLANRRDTSYWAAIRPIPLMADEVKSYQRKDSLKLAQVKTDSVRKAKPVASFVSDLLMGHRYRLCDSVYYIDYHGLINPFAVGFNVVDGVSYGQGLQFGKRFSDTTTSFYVDVEGRYAFKRKVFMGNVNMRYNYWPEQRALVNIEGGYKSRDFNKESGVASITNEFNSLLFRKNVINFYDASYFKFDHEIDIANGLRFFSGFEWEQRKPLHNTTNYSFFSHNRDYRTNDPDNLYVVTDPTLLDNHKSATVELKLQYTPEYYYRKRGRYKRMVTSNYPTFTLSWKKGLKGIADSETNFDLISAGIFQSIDLPMLSNVEYSLSGGKFFNRKNMHFADFKHFSIKEPDLLFEDFYPAFHELKMYQPSTNEWYVTGRVHYATQYLLLKYLPFLSNTLWAENIGVSYLHTPVLKHYIEPSYSITNIGLLGSVGVFVGFEDFKYQSVGVKASIKLNFNVN